MFCENLVQLRKLNRMSQEELAEKVDVSIEKCMLLADIFGVTLDDLVNYQSLEPGLGVPPRGKYAFGVVSVGEKGQIVIPAKARKVFDINPGDNLLVLGDEERGIAIVKAHGFLEYFERQKHKNE